MKISAILFLLIAVFSCNNNKEYKKAEDAQDAGRQFIRATLDGDYEKAQFYLLKDSFNLQFLRKWKNIYDNSTSKEKSEYEGADIRPVKIEPVNDSLVNYVYTNSYKPTDTVLLNVLRVNGEWLVDLQHFQGWKH